MYTETRSNPLPGAVILDLDDIFYSYEPAHEAALKKAAKKALHLFGMDLETFYHLFQLSTQHVDTQMGRVSQNYLLYFLHMTELMGLKTQTFHALDLEQTYWRAFLEEIKLWEDAVDFLEIVHAQGVPVMLLTDLSAQTQIKKLMYLELDPFIDLLVTAEESGHPKSDAQTFALALKKLGALQAPIWVIGSGEEYQWESPKGLPPLVHLQKMGNGAPVASHNPITFTDWEEILRPLQEIPILSHL